MGISAACANLKTSLMHAYKAGVIHLLMWPQCPQRRRCSRGVAQRTAMMSCRQAGCFPSAEVTRFWRALKNKQKKKQNGSINLHLPLGKKKKFIMSPKYIHRITLKVLPSATFEENKLNSGVCVYFSGAPSLSWYIILQKKERKKESSMSAALSITNINKPFMYR